MNDAKRTRVQAHAQAEPAAAPFNPYADNDAAVEMAKRLAQLINTSPFSMWSEREAGERGEEFYILAPDMARSPRANRLAIAFGQAVAGGMPGSTSMLILAEWAGVAVRALASDPGAAILRETIEVAYAVAAAPDPKAFPGIDDTLARLEHGNSNECVFHALNDWARNEIEYYVHADVYPAKSAPGYEAWWRATDVLGSIEGVLGEAAEAGFEACERILGQHIYPWAQPGASQLAPRVPRLLPNPRSTNRGLDSEDMRELYPEQVALEQYAAAALAQAGDDDVGQARVLGAVSDALVAADLSAYADAAAGTRALLRELRLDGRPVPEVIASYRRIMADRSDTCSGTLGTDPATCDCSKCAADRAYEDRFAAAFEQNYAAHFALGERPALERLAEILGSFEYAFGETSERVFGAALEALRGKQG